MPIPPMARMGIEMRDLAKQILPPIACLAAEASG